MTGTEAGILFSPPIHSSIHLFILALIRHILALWAWDNCLVALWLSLHICKVG